MRISRASERIWAPKPFGRLASTWEMRRRVGGEEGYDGGNERRREVGVEGRARIRVRS